MFEWLFGKKKDKDNKDRSNSSTDINSSSVLLSDDGHDNAADSTIDADDRITGSDSQDSSSSSDSGDSGSSDSGSSSDSSGSD